jgi:hypothetical protein
MFKKNMFKIVDDPVRFSNAYIMFLVETGSLEHLNKGFSTIRQVFKLQVSLPRTLQGNDLTLQAKSGAPQSQSVAVEMAPVVEAETKVSVNPGTENKRKLSVSDETGSSKKIKTGEENDSRRSVPHCIYDSCLGIANMPASWHRISRMKRPMNRSVISSRT